ncbi:MULTISPECIES: DUF2771 domain-containing protein [Actinomycetes]|uniref:DUF2771 domain-containing protein n=1 Tax=Mycolicibacterium neoaurum VKM Ac-1815D TaxID=700508 RepID=V5XHG7_MYCNE|nr:MULTISPECIES: DUF2771 domain-containing protein [Actinomycetes]AHC27273.1 hypothetical protein D174_23195 [Mycolicibacterium neoaurum VKM Ac-1815D]AMO07506.1 hypothetical protein MyAD_22745 [Mycolicibacterium neoaurum]AXK74104.1 DUF2771 domain-containing protein [Mycolicibacterium neoaurum]KJQ51458.1 hypothetical protein TS71_01330 [Mycolicibacterium neoaurum]KUM09217.1 hypothetical protein AVZ31_06005 [Mycolicibacterium neoaurum]
MKRGLAALAIVALLATAGTVALVMQLRKQPHSPFPQISAYSHGETVRIGPYFYCSVENLDDCENPETTGELTLTSRSALQLSVEPAIARAPWWLARTYEGADAAIVQEFRPNTRTAVTIPPIDARYGRLTGVVVQLPTLVRDEFGNEFPLPHAEWSVRTVWEPSAQYPESVSDYPGH